MRAKLTLLSLLAVSTLGGVLATGCQTYDFEPVEPLAISQTTETRVLTARASKPNLMLLVDTSGSMTQPADSTKAACRPGGTLCGSTETPCNTTTCPTRWSELQLAMQDFLDTSGSIARMGLATYPARQGDGCGASSALSVPLPAGEAEDTATLTANAAQVKGKLLAIKNASSSPTEPVPTGGTPTSLSLRFVGGLPELQSENRTSFVLLLTDGLPNCNAAFETPYPDAGCFCTLTSCNFAPDIGCLDTNASVRAVNELKAKKIQTIVIGLGADFNASSESGIRGVATLNGMAEAGGFARTCTTDAQCGAGDTCDATGLCKRRFYQAANRAELVNALKEITDKVTLDKPCLLTFDPTQRPSSESLVVVYLNGERLSPGPDTWALTADGVEFSGSACERITSSTPTNPANIEVRAIQRR